MSAIELLDRAGLVTHRAPFRTRYQAERACGRVRDQIESKQQPNIWIPGDSVGDGYWVLRGAIVAVRLDAPAEEPATDRHYTTR